MCETKAQAVKWPSPNQVPPPPEILKSELREIRSAVEANNSTRFIEDTTSPLAAGLVFMGNNPVTLRVWIGKVEAVYKLDRWD